MVFYFFLYPSLSLIDARPQGTTTPHSLFAVFPLKKCSSAQDHRIEIILTPFNTEKIELSNDIKHKPTESPFLFFTASENEKRIRKIN